MLRPLKRVCGRPGKRGGVYTALIVAILAVFAVGAEAAQPDGIDFGRYRALVIGINDYTNLPKLGTAVNDASAMHDVLRTRYGFESTLLLNPKRYDLIRALDAMRAELTENDNLLIYYAGHGFLDPQTDDGFWLPVDAEESSTANWIAVADVTRALKGMTAKHVLIIADSCYSGTLTRDVPIVVKTGSERLAELRRLNQKRARKAMTSGGLEPVMDGGGDGHSVFTRALLENLRDNGDVLDGYQLYAKLRRSVVVNAQQTPEYSDIRFAGDEGGEFLFVPVGLPASVAAAPAATAGPAATTTGPNQAAMDLAFWQSIQNSERPGDFEAYLQQFPNGTFAVLARNRMAALEAPEEELEPAAPQPAPQQQAALTPPAAQPPAPAPVPEAVAVDTIDETYVAMKNANVRDGPDSKAGKLTTLSMGSSVGVTGKVKGKNWYRVALEDGRTGYIFAPLLTEAGSGQQQAMVSGSGIRAVPGRGQRVFRIQPVVHDGRRIGIASDILRAGLSGLPNSFVVAGGGKANPGDTVVSAIISQLNVTREPNPEYTGAAVMRSLFGKLGQTITANVPQYFSVYRAAVAIRAHDLATGTVTNETANTEIKLNADFPTRDGIELALQQALTEATQRLATQISFQR